MNTIEIESAVCGMMMRDKRNLAEAVSGGLVNDHFSNDLCGKIYEACFKIWRDGKDIDLSTVSRLVGSNHLEEIARIRSSAPVTVNFEPYMKAVIDASRQLELQAKLSDLSRRMSGRRAMDSLDPIIEDLTTLVVNCKGNSSALRVSHIADIVDRSLTAGDERIRDYKKGIAPGIPTGIKHLDKLLYGFQSGFMYVLGARTMIGKTTMAMNMALGAAKAGHKTVFVTVEMSDTDIVDKMLSRVGRVNISDYLSGRIAGDDENKIKNAANKLERLPITFVEIAKPDFDLLSAEIFKQVKVDKAKLIIIDYLQIFELAADGRYRNAREEAKSISIRIKSLARSLNVPILVLSQLNRQAPEDGEPDLTHIAETDQIARDADVVLFLYKIGNAVTADYMLSIAKHRRGCRMAIRLNADLQFNLFEGMNDD